MLRKTLVLLIALVATPLAASSGSYSNDGALNVLVGTPGASDSHVYAVALAAGDSVTVSLSWTGDADLDLRVTSPDAPSCALLPEPDAPCVVAGLGQRDVTCANSPAPLALGGSESRSFVAATSGTYEIIVLASVAAPGVVGYHIDIDGASGSVSGPEAVRFLGTNPVCKL